MTSCDPLRPTHDLPAQNLRFVTPNLPGLTPLNWDVKTDNYGLLFLSCFYSASTPTRNHRIRLRGQPGHVPSIIEKCPCIYHFLPPFAPPYFGLPTQYLWQVYASAWNLSYYRPTCKTHMGHVWSSYYGFQQCPWTRCKFGDILIEEVYKANTIFKTKFE